MLAPPISKLVADQSPGYWKYYTYTYGFTKPDAMNGTSTFDLPITKLVRVVTSTIIVSKRVDNITTLINDLNALVSDNFNAGDPTENTLA